MAALFLYCLMTAACSGLMLRIIKADNLKFKEYCEDMFNVKMIQKKRSLDRSSSIMVAVVCHSVLLLLAIIYWIYILTKGE